MSVDNRLRRLANANVTTVTTVTTGEWSLLFSPDDNRSELYHLPTDPSQHSNVIASQSEVARGPPPTARRLPPRHKRGPYAAAKQAGA